MANIFSTNLTGTGAAMIFALKTLLKTAGWTVRSSGDATTYNASGDQITHAGGGAGGMANTRAWFVVRMPGTTRELCFQRTTNNTLWRVKYSKADGFTGGSPSANTVPSAADEQVIHGSGSDASSTGAALFATDSTYYTQIMAQDAAPYGFWLGSYLASTRAVATALFLDPLAADSYPNGDGDPYVLRTSQGAAAWLSGQNQGSLSNMINGPVAWINDSGFGAMPACAPVNWSSTTLRVLSAGSGANAISNEDVFLPVIYGRSSSDTPPNGIKGVSSLLRWNSNSRTSGDTTADLAYIQMGHVVLPWDGATIPTT